VRVSAFNPWFLSAGVPDFSRQGTGQACAVLTGSGDGGSGGGVRTLTALLKEERAKGALLGNLIASDTSTTTGATTSSSTGGQGKQHR
jgi:hypothetical protein